MQGTILNFEQNHGLISGQDGNRYEFVPLHWMSTSEPYAGMQVDFIEYGNEAKSVFPLQMNNAKSKAVLAYYMLVLRCFRCSPLYGWYSW